MHVLLFKMASGIPNSPNPSLHLDLEEISGEDWRVLPTLLFEFVDDGPDNRFIMRT